MFAEVPGSPFAYWVSEPIRGAFRRCDRFESGSRNIKQGLATADDFRFVRCWWECLGTHAGLRWFGFAKGGAFSPFYADVPLMLEWCSNGAVLKAKVIAKHGNAGKRIYNEEFYFRPGLTWPRRTNGLSFRAMPAGCIFADKGPAAFVDGDSPADLFALAAIMNSTSFGYLVSVQLARTELAQSYEVGLIQQTPVPELKLADVEVLARLARRAWSLKRRLDTTNETSHAFVLPHGPNEQVTGLDPAAIERELADIQREIDDRAFDLYGIGPEDRATIEAASRRPFTTRGEDEPRSGEDLQEDATKIGHSEANPFTTRGDREGEDDDELGGDEEGDVPRSFPGEIMPTLISWFVGVAFGRFDLRLATGERPIPPEPEPFDPLPRRSPGMWPEGEQPRVEQPAMLVDDPGHDYDLRSHVASSMARTGWPDPTDLRDWLARDFFPVHLRMYSKSRRKAPIYWQLGVPSGRYSVWLYAHRATRDTLYAVQDLVKDKLLLEERALADLVQSAGPHPTGGQRKDLEAKETLVEELRAFRDEVARVAPLWHPDLDDGVVLTKAPLWRLVPQHRAWQKELKSYWDGLCEGKYDWAHVAMHLWPERVVPKCAQDRSLAIAHDLEEVFWVENDKGKWAPRKEPTRPLADLIEERTSPAVKSALASLMAAPTATGAPTKRGRKAKKNA